MITGKQNFPEYLFSVNKDYADEVPSGRDTHIFVEKIIDRLFPFRTKSKRSLEELQKQLQEQVLVQQLICRVSAVLLS